VPFQVGAEGRTTKKPGVYYVGSGYRTSIGGLSRLIIPILIAGTLVMNTMLGSVFERKQEIAIYNAVGLNPTHIVILFLAEAFVYGILGAVGGYLIGQLLSMGLNATGLVPGVNFNFSSLSVVYVIAFTVSLVLLSTIYPSLVATRAAVPSGQRKWSMPPHKGDAMEVALPFIYHESLLAGAVRYMEAYFERFTEASVGEMIAVQRGRGHERDADGREVYHLDYDVALAPFDLGVTQKLRVRAGYDGVVGAYRLVLSIRRVSGQDSNWTTTNKPFLEKLRAYLMHWRNLSAAEHAAFAEAGRRRFGPAAEAAAS
jgi:hypothetical protein